MTLYDFTFELAQIEMMVEAMLIKQLLVGTFLNNFTILDH